MPVALTAGLIAGAAMAAGGTAAAIKANQMKTQPRGVAYGGSSDALDAYRKQYAGGQADGANLRGAGVQTLGGIGDSAAETTTYGRGLIEGALGRETAPNYRAQELVSGAARDANKAAQVAAANQLDQVTAKNIAMSRGTGALGMRQAMYENAAAGAQSAQDLATVQANNEVQGLLARAGQLNTGDQLQLAQREQNLREAGLGAGLLAQGYGTQTNAAQSALNAGLITEGRYMDATQNVEQAQMMSDLDYERRRQADAQRRSQNLWNLGQGLITGGARVMGSAGGGGGAGGAA